MQRAHERCDQNNTCKIRRGQQHHVGQKGMVGKEVIPKGLMKWKASDYTLASKWVEEEIFQISEQYLIDTGVNKTPVNMK